MEINNIIKNWEKNIWKINYDSYTVYRMISDYKMWKIFLKPAYQRVYKWNILQKSKLIESIFLWIPLPSIFIYWETVNQYEVIDWLQRVSAILEFLWVLKSKNTPWSYLKLKPHIDDNYRNDFEIIEKLYYEIDYLKDKRISFLAIWEFEEAKQKSEEIYKKEEEIEVKIKKISILKWKIDEINKDKNWKRTDIKKKVFENIQELSILSDLNWKKFDDLDTGLKNSFMYKIINITILTSTNNEDSHVKYELFYRLNSWGTQLTPQEIRNSLLLYLVPNIYNLLLEKKKISSFKGMLNIKHQEEISEKDTEYVFKFFTLIYFDKKISDIDNVNRFIDSFMWNIIDNKIEIDWNIFDKTFEILNKINWFDSLKRFHNNNFSWKWMVPWFDTIAWWIWYNILNNNIDTKLDNTKEIKSRIKALRKCKKFSEHIKTWWFVEHKLIVSIYIGRKLFNLKEDFWKTEEEIWKKIDNLLDIEFNKKYNYL